MMGCVLYARTVWEMKNVYIWKYGHLCFNCCTFVMGHILFIHNMLKLLLDCVFSKSPIVIGSCFFEISIMNCQKKTNSKKEILFTYPIKSPEAIQHKLL